MNIFQFIAVFLDLSIAFLILYLLLMIIVLFFQQLYIRTRCQYRGFKEKPGRACVVCKYQKECSRAWKSKDYVQYIFCRASHPDQAQELFDEIQPEEESNPK